MESQIWMGDGGKTSPLSEQKHAGGTAQQKLYSRSFSDPGGERKTPVSSISSFSVFIPT